MSIERAATAEQLRAAGAELEQLTCGGCGAAVALADAESAPCPRCGGAVVIPEAHRGVFALEQRDAATRAEAHLLYEKLGVRPGRALRVLAVLFNGWWMLAGGALVMLFASLFVVDFTLFMVASAFHTNLAETMPRHVGERITFPLALAVTLAGVALGVYGRRRALSRLRMQAALGAKPPEREGGPAACRSCGAPLTVPDAALGVRCVYCGSDNLVALPPEWLARVHEDVTAVHAEIEQAQADLGVERQSFKRALVKHVGGVGVALSLLVVLTVTRPLPNGPQAPVVPPDWTTFAVEPRPLVHRGVDASVKANAPGARLASHYERLNFVAQCPIGAAPLEFDPRDCDAKGCVARLYAALREGERASITVTGLPRLARLRIERHGKVGWPDKADETFGRPVKTLDIVPGATASFVATWSAWHELELETKGPMPTQARVCFGVTR